MDTVEVFILEVKENGRVLLPVAFCSLMGLHSGDRFIVTVTQKGKAELMTAQHAITSTRGLFAARLANEPSLADELLSERRIEASRE